MSEAKVSSDENSISSDVENDILEDLGDKIKCLKTSVWTWEGGNNIGSRYDESEKECSEESDEECSSHSAIKEHVRNTTWCKCFKCNVEKIEIDCLCCHSTEQKVW